MKDPFKIAKKKDLKDMQGCSICENLKMEIEEQKMVIAQLTEALKYQKAKNEFRKEPRKVDDSVGWL
mgnify:CR=1 FL=1